MYIYVGRRDMPENNKKNEKKSINSSYILLFIGICLISEVLEREGSRLKKARYEFWSVPFGVSIQLCLLLLRTKEQYPSRGPPARPVVIDLVSSQGDHFYIYMCIYLYTYII
jgi:uncharacterized membrane protein